MKKYWISGGLALALLVLTLSSRPTDPLLPVVDDASVAALLHQLGEPLADHQPDYNLGGVSLELGRSLVLQGRGLNGRQSKHFVCTSCHNVVVEDPDLSVSDPEARLTYVAERSLPFLPGTTLYGVVNRTSFYNGDYDKKYGDLVTPARHSLRGAIQLCATECAQGEALSPVEMESVLAYLWTIDLKVGDLGLSAAERQQLERALADQDEQAAARALLHRHYSTASPATFNVPPPDRQAGYAATGRPERGQLIYELSCLHCHGEQRYSFFNLDDSRYSFDFLLKHLPRYTRYSTYQVVRYGTSPIAGKRAYMPHYPLEKMSDQQVEDLRAYITQRASQPERSSVENGR